MNRYTNEEIISRCKKVHGDKNYDYSKVNYVNSKTKMTFICPEHGEFEQRFNDFLNAKYPCPYCSGKIMNNKAFLLKAKKIHRDKYDYSKIGEIKSSKNKIIIICPEHGEFIQEVNSHLQGRGCPICAGKKFSLKDYIKKANKIWNNKYDYSKVVWKGVNEKVCIICPEHGEFWQLPNNHLKGECGCLQCRGKNSDFKYINGLDDFLELANKKFPDSNFDYSKIEWKGSREKICIVCPKHGDFWVLPYQFLQNKKGCPLCGIECTQSKGELEIQKVLDKYNFQYKREFCILNDFFTKEDIKPRVDFILKYNNKLYIIEFNGQQHYIPIDVFGGKLQFEKQVKRDQLLRDFCKLHSDKLNLLEIKFDTNFNDIEKIILNFVGYKE